MVLNPPLDPEYRSALEFLYSFVDYEQNGRWKYDGEHFDLERVQALLAALGNPHHRGWFIHVAGTNGKGSICAMTASALQEAGLSVGLYTSPHLVTFRERIRLNGALMPAGEVVEGVRRLRPAAEGVAGLTFFDVWTALAFDFYARKGADAAVIEVGMGGRLDSTNVITPAVSVIASISMDHRGKLGDTLAQIAAEKAGIMKPGVPAVIAPQSDREAVRVLAERARETGSELILVGRDATWGKNPDGTLWYRGKAWAHDSVSLPLPGSFQYENAATALAALETLAFQGYPISSDAAKRGIEQTRWHGRLETVAHRPEVIVDGACNTGAMIAVRDFLLSRGSREGTVAVVAMCRDKDMKDVLAILGEAASRIVFTKVHNPRAMEADDLSSLAPKGVKTWVDTESAEAVRKAIELAGLEGTVIATGSLYLVGEVFRMYGLGEEE
ncbi:MAG: bifunctional folylpolyglutamate synthase/dihydrofolate synthase [Candidatus Latescibacterota bacterium]